MTVILTVHICVRGFCIETYVPTPTTFRCDDPSYHEKYLASQYPRWRYEAYTCRSGRDA